MFDSSTFEKNTTHLGAIWLNGRNGFRFRFEVREAHSPAPGAVEIQSCIRQGRYVRLRLVPSGQAEIHPMAQYTLTHRPDKDDKFSVEQVIAALKS
ncbi:hypothetical protein [Pontivivens nitratireducens]|uniref:Uncharacterized protein n=1 Tax=Pontivivens nitratireducens TaxID=2758038 RepID=A0A6G7VPW6_9RHOB|nr:hypothetical protein [Pontibrevibacter nitratireducens]QIK41898.1 hypothetical protein G8E03_14705 [Pontibrevibacter nitratireducens]